MSKIILFFTVTVLYVIGTYVTLDVQVEINLSRKFVTWNKIRKKKSFFSANHLVLEKKQCVQKGLKRINNTGTTCTPTTLLITKFAVELVV